MRISIIGVPGSGKTTLAQLLSNMFGVMFISSGALARAHGFNGSEAEARGQLDPDEEKIRKLVKEAVGDSTHYILDGFPRAVHQIEKVDMPLDAVIHLKVYNEQIAIDRLLKRGRPDDILDTIEMRIATYYRHTHPLAGYFDKRKLLIDVNASDSIAYTLAQAVIQMADWGILEASEFIKKIRRPKRKRDAGKVGGDREVSQEGT